MEPFTVVRGPAAPLLLPDVNTDLIAPAHGGRANLADNAFAPLRYLADGRDNPHFVLNDKRFRGAPILLAGPNFGCGSSRETAVWSLLALGIRCVIAESFGDIFRGNCFQNSVLPVALGHEQVVAIADEAAAGAVVEVDLQATTITLPSGHVVDFTVETNRRLQLLVGLDDLDAALQRRQQIRAFQAADRTRRPWVYPPHELRT